MSWTAYRVTFKLLSPVHVGWHKLGNLQQTRPYITGRSLWGALTARLTRQYGSDKYKDMGKKVDDQLAFTYFYPSKSPEPDGVELWPWREQWDKFAWTFLSSYASTALENGHSSEAGSLHETEFISPRTRDGQQVYLVGYFFKKDSCELEWEIALSKLQLGGERGYGWGRVKLCICESVKPETCFGYKFTETEEYPHLQALDEMRLLAHTYAGEEDDRKGTIEPFIGRETDDKARFGRTITPAEVCWTPGSVAKKGDAFYIMPRGIWKPVAR